MENLRNFDEDWMQKFIRFIYLLNYFSLDKIALHKNVKSFAANRVFGTMELVPHFIDKKNVINVINLILFFEE